MSINFFDRLLSKVAVPLEQLQTAALACLVLAAKKNDSPSPIRMPHISKYFHNVCTANDMRRAQLNILLYLGWDLNAFTPVDMMRALLHLVPDLQLQDKLEQEGEAIFMHASLGE